MLPFRSYTDKILIIFHLNKNYCYAYNKQPECIFNSDTINPGCGLLIKANSQSSQNVIRQKSSPFWTTAITRSKYELPDKEEYTPDCHREKHTDLPPQCRQAGKILRAGRSLAGSADKPWETRNLLPQRGSCGQISSNNASSTSVYIHTYKSPERIIQVCVLIPYIWDTCISNKSLRVSFVKHTLRSTDSWILTILLIA